MMKKIAAMKIKKNIIIIFGNNNDKIEMKLTSKHISNPYHFINFDLNFNFDFKFSKSIVRTQVYFRSMSLFVKLRFRICLGKLIDGSRIKFKNTDIYHKRRPRSWAQKFDQNNEPKQRVAGYLHD